MRSLNRVTLIGTLGRDAETKFTANQVSVTNFSVATERRWKDAATGDYKNETDWHNVVLWRGEAVAPYLLKGTKVYVEGRLCTRNYEKNGEKKYVTEIVSENIILLGSKDGGGKPVASARQSAVAAPSHDSGFVDEEDVPFS